jgi:MFS family permease
MLLAVGLQTGARNFAMFISSRLLLGFGNSIVLGSAPLLIAELAHPQDRAVLVTLSGASYHSGAFLASWVTLGTLQIKVCLHSAQNSIISNLGDRVIGLGDCLVCCRVSAQASSS